MSPGKIQGQGETGSASHPTPILLCLGYESRLLVLWVAKSQCNSSRVRQGDYMDKFRALNTPNPPRKFRSQNY